MTVQSGLCQTWSESQLVGLLMHRLNYPISVSKEGIQGMVARFILLDGAKPTFSRGDSRSWTKFGNFHTASLDFYSVNPLSVRQYDLPDGVSNIFSAKTEFISVTLSTL